MHGHCAWSKAFPRYDKVFIDDIFDISFRISECDLTFKIASGSINDKKPFSSNWERDFYINTSYDSMFFRDVQL